MQPDAASVRAFLARVSKRLAWRSAAEGAAAGVGAAIITMVARHPAPTSLGATLLVLFILVGIGLLISVYSRRNARRHVALLVERRTPQSRNLIVTADELAGRERTGYVDQLVFREAAQLVERLDPRVLVPTMNALVALGATTGVWLLLLMRPGGPIIPSSTAFLGNAGVTLPSIERVDVTVTPPPYSGRPTQTLHDPTRVEVLAGSSVALAIRASAASVSIETLASRDTVAMAASGAFTKTLVANADGYVAIEPAGGGRTGARRLIGLTVIPDAPPRVKITAPGRDTYLRDGHATLDVAIDAADDIGLANLTLKYTKVSGSGERFTFAEGNVPLRVTRTDARTWTARVSWPLDSLALEPGDMVVYRAIAADHRPGSAPVESDSYIAEVLSPGGVAAPGFAMDPEQERYAVSQQMVILKTERLQARKATMSAEDYTNEAQEIAVEQRKVRAEFVFMLGGELADAPDLATSMTDLNEEAEAAGEEDLLAGRAANAGHIALLRAIRAMSRAATSLTTADLPPALTHERAALKQLEAAFSRTRILLRALTTRERLDLSRRLTGVLTDAARETHPNAAPEADSRTIALRRALSGVAALGGTRRLGPSDAAQASALAERVLQVDASAKQLQDVSAQLANAATALSNGQSDEARGLIDRATTGLASAIRGELLDAPHDARRIEDALLQGALRDAVRDARIAPSRP